MNKLIFEEKDIQETLYLYNIPNYIDTIKIIIENENWDEAEEYKIDEEW